MMLANTKSTIESVLEWLKGTDEEGWPDQLAALEESIVELERMSSPLLSRSKSGSRSAAMPIFAPGSEKMRMALQHLERLIFEMSRHNRVAAIEAGTEALAVL